MADQYSEAASLIPGGRPASSERKGTLRERRTPSGGRYPPFINEVLFCIDIVFNAAGCTDRQMDVAESVSFYYKLSVLPLLLLVALGYYTGLTPFTNTVLGGLVSSQAGAIVLTVILLWIALPLALAALSIVCHIIGHLSGFRDEFQRTFCSVIYAISPYLLLSSIPELFGNYGIFIYTCIGLLSVWVFANAAENQQGVDKVRGVCVLGISALLLGLAAWALRSAP